MQTDYGWQAQIPEHGDVPDEARRIVLQQQLATAQRRLKRSGTDAAKAQRLAEQYRARLRSSLGQTRYERLRTYVEEQKQKQREQLEPPAGPDLPLEEVAELRTRRREESVSALKKLGIDLQNLAAANRRSIKSLARLAPGPPMRDGKPVRLVKSVEVPKAIRSGKANPWSAFRPPYQGWSWFYSWWAAGFGFDSTLYLDSAAGLVGNRNNLRDSDAGDFDVGLSDYNAAIGFWYRMPTSGLIEAWIEAQSVTSHHHATLIDEWGWSSSRVDQNDYLTLKADGPTSDEWRKSRMSWFTEVGYTDGYWDNHYLTDGGTYWAHLFTDTAFSAGSWVWVQVGTWTNQYTFANDVSVTSEASFKWYINSVWVESTGG